MSAQVSRYYPEERKGITLFRVLGLTALALIVVGGVLIASDVKRYIRISTM